MPLTVAHALVATTPDNTSYEIRPSHWNSAHNVTFSATAGSEVIGAFSNGGNVTFALDGGGKITASAPSGGGGGATSMGIFGLGHTTGQSSSSTFALTGLPIVGAGIISIGQSAGSLQISATTPIGSVNFSAGTASANLASVVWSNSNGVSFGLNGATMTASAAGGSTSLSATGAVSLVTNGGTVSIGVPPNSVGISGGNTAGLTGVVSNQVVFAGGNAITLSGSSNAGGATITIGGATAAPGIVQFSGGTTSNNLATLVFSNSNAVTFGLNGGTLTASFSTGAGAGVSNATIYVGGNSTGQSTSSTFPLSNLTLVGGGLISIGESLGSIQISGPSTAVLTQMSVGFSTDGNTASNSGVVTGLVDFVGAGNITLSGSTNGGSMTISINGQSYTALTFQNRALENTATTYLGNNSLWFGFAQLDAPVSASTLMAMVSLNGVMSSNQTNTVAVTIQQALYQQNSTAVSEFDTIWNKTLGFTAWNSGTVSGSWSINCGTVGQQSSSSSAGIGISSQIYGIRQITMAIGSVLNPGLYAYAVRYLTTSSGDSTVLQSVNAIIDNPIPVNMGLGLGSATNSSIGIVDGGLYSHTSAAMPASINITDVHPASNQVPYFQLGAV